MRKKAGFTLLEIIVSVAIVAVIVVLTYQFFFQGISVWQRQRAKTEALSSSRAALEHISSRLRESNTVWTAEEKDIAFSQWPANSTSLDEDTVGLWHFDDGEPGEEGDILEVADAAPNPRHGTIIMAPDTPVEDEPFIAYHETWFQLEHNEIRKVEFIAPPDPSLPGCEIVTDEQDDPEELRRIRGVDYEMCPVWEEDEGSLYFTQGIIKALGSEEDGEEEGMVEGNTYYIDYTYKNSGPAWTVGYSGYALSFDGCDDVVRIPHAAKFALEEFTIELWFYLPENMEDFEFKGEEAVLFAKDLSEHNHGDVRLSGQVSEEGKLEELCFYLDDGSTEHALCSAFISWETEQWYHLAATCRKTAEGKRELNLYLSWYDEEAEQREMEKDTEEVTFSGKAMGNQADIYVGAADAEGSQAFAGLIDELKISDIARPQPLNEYSFSGEVGDDLVWYYKRGQPDEKTGPVAKGVEEFKVEYLDSKDSVLSPPITGVENLVKIRTVYFHLKTVEEEETATLTTKIYPRNI